MQDEEAGPLRERGAYTRRHFLRALGGTVAAAASSSADAAGPEGAAAQNRLRVDIPTPEDRSDYLTFDKDFGTVERGDPPPYQLPEPKKREIGMTRDTWKLEVLPDTATGAHVDAPLSRARGTALDFSALMKLAETRSVRFLKVMTCNNLNAPLGMGLWEGVPLRDVIWMARPVSDIRRVYYYGHHNEDPKQMFRSSLSLSRVLEDQPGDYPVILAYKLNGQYLSGTRGGPVRMIVPEAYGFKSVKWLQRVVLTNLFGANDTYADENNDIDSWMKTFARFAAYPQTARSSEAIPVSGIAQVGVSGLSKVQIWLHRQGTALPANDPAFTSAPWQEARILSPPERWGGGLPNGATPAPALGFELGSGKPKAWPVRYSVAHWSAVLRGVPAGVYDLRCRTIDASGIAQPMPRPLPKSGVNTIEQVTLTVKP